MVSKATSLNISGDKVSQSDTPVQLARPPIGKPEQVVTAKAGAIPQQGGTKFLVTYVEDGDTLSGKTDRGNLKCRLEKIDTPEIAHPNANKPGQPYGNQAKKLLEDMVANKEVSVRVVKEKDKWGRSVCQIEVEGHNIEQAMLEKGAAWLSRKYFQDPNLVAAEDKAIKNRKGLWADPAPGDPAAFRRRIK